MVLNMAKFLSEESASNERFLLCFPIYLEIKVLNRKTYDLS